MSEVLTKYGTLKGVITPTFYPNGSLKECILEEYNEIKTRYGILVPSYEQYEARKKYTRSISFYNDGNIKSLEPKNPTLIKTAIGGIKAYNTNVLGINDDSNSLTFSEDGKIISLVSATDEIIIVDRSGNRSTVKQTLKQNLFDNEVMDVIPLKVEFFEDKVRFNNDVKSEYVIKDNIFIVDHKQVDEDNICGNCDECGACT